MSETFSHRGAEAEILVSRRSPRTPMTVLFPAVSNGRELFVAVAYPENHRGHDGGMEGSVAYQWADEPTANFAEFYFKTEKGTYEYYNFETHGLTSSPSLKGIAQSIVEHALKQTVRIVS